MEIQMYTCVVLSINWLEVFSVVLVIRCNKNFVYEFEMSIFYSNQPMTFLVSNQKQTLQSKFSIMI